MDDASTEPLSSCCRPVKGRNPGPRPCLRPQLFSGTTHSSNWGGGLGGVVSIVTVLPRHALHTMGSELPIVSMSDGQISWCVGFDCHVLMRTWRDKRLADIEGITHMPTHIRIIQRLP